MAKGKELEQPCEQCASIPGGIEGHPLLALHAEKARKATFMCGSCGTQWIRIYEGGGHFKWQRINGR